ncbi:hypothetical protein BJ944DRAFT_80554, partial [Cunninghamella echinulata]
LGINHLFIIILILLFCFILHFDNLFFFSHFTRFSFHLFLCFIELFIFNYFSSIFHFLFYRESGRCSPSTTLYTVDSGLSDITSTNEVRIDVLLPRHVYIIIFVLKKR